MYLDINSLMMIALLVYCKFLLQLTLRTQKNNTALYKYNLKHGSSRVFQF